MASASFPLLQLPSLAFKEIIKNIELQEQFKLAICSKRMHFAVKNYRRKSAMSLRLSDFIAHTEICIFRKNRSLCLSTYFKNEITFRVQVEGREIEDYPSLFKETKQLFPNRMNAMQKTKFLIELLCDLFAAKVEEIKVFDNKIWILDFVEERQGGYSYDAVVWNETKQTDEELRHVLLDLHPRSLTFHQQTCDEFRIENFDKKYEKLTVSAAKWMTVKNLFQLDCVKLKIHKKRFSNTEINWYLKHVLNGEAPRLCEFMADVENPIEDEIMDGVQDLLTGRERSEDRNGNWKWNGKVATEEGSLLVNIKFLRFGRICVYI